MTPYIDIQIGGMGDNKKIRFKGDVHIITNPDSEREDNITDIFLEDTEVLPIIVSILVAKSEQALTIGRKNIVLINPGGDGKIYFDDELYVSGAMLVGLTAELFKVIEQ